ncbi:MAG: hypothetical protein IT539_00620 [Bradyrhizobiaceae bacterium]|nr:hypothetical protein [Bradyrhizobiaceae bacterium]
MASSSAIDKAAAAFRKEEQKREGQQAMTEYLAARAAEETKIARLKALRLARDAASVEAEPAPKAARKLSAKK